MSWLPSSTQTNTSGVYYLNAIADRMFGSSVDRHMIQCNEYGEYEVAKGVPARLFAAILVSFKVLIIVTRIWG